MIIKDKDATARLSSPMNLINRLRSNGSRSSAMQLFGVGRKIEVKQIEIPKSFNPFPTVKTSEPPQVPQTLPEIPETKLDNILDNHESQIKLGLAHDNAITLLNNSIDALTAKLDDVKADKLPAVIAAAAKTVEGIRRERNEQSKNNKDREVHYHFYTPQQKKISDYEVIDVTQ